MDEKARAPMEVGEMSPRAAWSRVLNWMKPLEPTVTEAIPEAMLAAESRTRRELMTDTGPVPRVPAPETVRVRGLVVPWPVMAVPPAKELLGLVRMWVPVRGVSRPAPWRVPV